MRWIIYCWYISEYITDISHRDDVCKYPEQCIPGHIQQYIPDILQDYINDIFQGDDVSNIFNNVFRDIFNNTFLIYCKIISTTYSRAMIWASILGNIFNNRFLDISATCSGRWSGQASRAIYSWYIPRYINDYVSKHPVRCIPRHIQQYIVARIQGNVFWEMLLGIREPSPSSDYYSEVFLHLITAVNIKREFICHSCN